ncbi:Swt1 family HEPN domain-containing protein [Corynebacterium variabile]|uniref:Swt1 family HEPN domain-containing protein n=1 Tax=Corynebacterium variabile TaxID=1727 RepID=UPI003F965363
MTPSPTSAVSELLSTLSQRLDPLIAARLATHLGGAGGLPWTTVLAELDRTKGRSRHSYSRTDLQSQLRVLTERLGGLGYPFDDNLRQVSTVANELRIMRNRWAHNDQLSDLDAVRTADHATRLLALLGDTDGAAEAKTRRTGLIAAYATTTGLTAPVPAPEPDPTPIADPGYVGRHRSPTASATAPAAASSPARKPDTATPTIGTERFEYEPWEVVEAGGPEVIDALPTKDAKMQVRGVAAEIAEFEGPVSLDRLVTLTVRSFGMSRCGAKKKRQVAHQLKQLDLIIDADDFVWPTDIDPATWREFRPTGDDPAAADRAFTDISPVEIANAWRIIAGQHPDGAAVPDAEVRRGVLQVFGVTRAGSKVAPHLARAEALV